MIESDDLPEMLVDSSHHFDRLHLLQVLRKTPLSQSELTDQFDISRPTINRFIGQLTPVYVRQRNNGYGLTGAGAIAVREVAEARERLSGEVLSLLTGSSYHYQLLQKLEKHPLQKRDLVEDPEMPSRSTIDRSIRTFEKHGILTYTDGQYTLTDEGERAIEIYNALRVAMAQISEKSNCFKNMAPEIEELPVAALDGERFMTAPEESPYTIRNAGLDFIQSQDETDIDHIRLFSTFFDLGISEAFFPFLENGAMMESVIPERMLDEMPTDQRGQKHVKQWLEEYETWEVYPGELPCSLIIFDEKAAVFGPRSVTTTRGGSGIIFATDPDVIDWAVERFREYVTDAYEPEKQQYINRQ